MLLLLTFFACGDADTSALEARIVALEAADEALQAELDAAEGAVAAANDDLSALQSQLDALQGDHEALQAQHDSDVAALQGEIDALQAEVDGLSLDATDLDERTSAVEDDVADLIASTDAMAPLFDYVDVDTSSDEVHFVGANVFVQSGSGSTDDGGSLTGLGNLFVGYNEDDGGADRGGSHNLVVGPEHSFDSWGGFVAGHSNYVSGPNASVLGGFQNGAGELAIVCGGTSNAADGLYSAILGGSSNDTTGLASAVTGGFSNEASAEASVVLGGATNTADDAYSTVYGGQSVTTSATYDYAP